MTVAQIPAAVAALEAAVAEDERQAAAQRAAAAAEAAQDGGADTQDSEEAPRSDFVSLRQRAAPFIDMLRRSADGGHDVVWGA